MKTVQVHIQMSSELKRMAKEVAKHHGINFSEYIRGAILNDIEQFWFDKRMDEREKERNANNPEKLSDE